MIKKLYNVWKLKRTEEVIHWNVSFTCYYKLKTLKQVKKKNLILELTQENLMEFLV